MRPLSRRPILMIFPLLFVASCARSAGPTPSEVRGVVVQRLNKLKNEFTAGNIQDIPPDVMAQAAGLDPNEVRSMVSNASVTSFFSQPFRQSGGPNWTGNFAAEVNISGPMDVATAHFRVSGQAILIPSGLWNWQFFSFGPLAITHVDGTST